MGVVVAPQKTIMQPGGVGREGVMSVFIFFSFISFFFTLVLCFLFFLIVCWSLSGYNAFGFQYFKNKEISASVHQSHEVTAFFYFSLKKWQFSSNCD